MQRSNKAAAADSPQPPLPPGADGVAVQAEPTSDLLVVAAGTRGQHDLETPGQALGTGLASDQPVEDRPEAITQHDRGGLGTAHCLVS